MWWRSVSRLLVWSCRLVSTCCSSVNTCSVRNFCREVDIVDIYYRYYRECVDSACMVVDSLSASLRAVLR